MVVKNLSTLKGITVEDLEAMSMQELRASASASVRALNRQVKAIRERGQLYVNLETGLDKVDRVKRYHGKDKHRLIEEVLFLQSKAEKFSGYMGAEGRKKSRELQESWEGVRESLIEIKTGGSKDLAELQQAQKETDELIMKAFKEGGNSWVDRAVVLGLDSRDAHNMLSDNADSQAEYMLYVMEEIARMDAETKRATEG